MISKDYNELNNLFGNNLDDAQISAIEKCFNNKEGFFYSSMQRKLFQKVLENKSFRTVLAPVFEMGILISWMENKKIVAFEENADIYELSQHVWKNKNADIILGNFLEEDISGKYDAIIFTCPCGWVKREEERSIRLEKEYINKCLNCLDKHGTMVITVPSNVLIFPLWQETRDRILADYSLEMIVHCGKLFPETGIDWYTLVISNCNQRESVYFSELNNNIEEIVRNYNSESGEFWIPAKELHTRWDITYMSPEYASLRRDIYNKNTTKLGEIAEIIRGVNFRPEERLEAGEYMILTPKLIDNNMISNEENRCFFCTSASLKNTRAQRAILKKNDIAFSLIGDMNWYKYTNAQNKIVANHNIAILRTKPENARHLELFFESNTGQEYLKKQTNLFSTGGVFSNISIANLKQFVVPDIKVLEAASRYQEIRNPIIKIVNAFEEAGWEVKEEYSNGRAMFDIALFHKGELKGAIEVKNYKSKDLLNKNQLIAQLKRYKKTLGLANMFLFFNKKLYVYINEQLVRLPEIPSPNSETIQQLSSMYLEDKIDVDSIVIKQLPNDAVSLSDSYLTESLWHDVIHRLDRMEGKIDDIHQVVKEIANQITNYQSLVERQIDRAVGADEIERILQSFTDECSERIICEVNHNYSEHEYLIEENKLQASLGKTAWNKLDKSSQTFLISSKLIYNNLLSIGNVVDYSGVCLLVTKALEVEMSNRFCKKYIAFLTDKYPGKTSLSVWPTVLLNKFGKKIRTKDFTLGSIAYVLCYSFADGISEEQKNNNQAKLLEYARSELFLDEYNDEKILSCLLEYAEWIEEVRKDYRNPSAHTNELKKVDAENCFDLVTDVEKILKIMMDSFKA